MFAWFMKKVWYDRGFSFTGVRVSTSPAFRDVT